MENQGKKIFSHEQSILSVRQFGETKTFENCIVQ